MPQKKKPKKMRSKKGQSSVLAMYDKKTGITRTKKTGTYRKRAKKKK